MDNGYAIRIPVHMMERINKVIHLDNQFLNEGVEMNDRINLIANELGISEDEVKECLVLKVIKKGDFWSPKNSKNHPNSSQKRPNKPM